jgi:hypothetical protein
MGLLRRQRNRDNARLEGLEARLDELISSQARPLDAPPCSPPRLLDAEATEGAISEVRTQLCRIDEQLALLDQRITQVTTELANQINELGSEMQFLADRAEPMSNGGLAAILEAQSRLAAEQARYQIAFREDLALLAARVRR